MTLQAIGDVLGAGSAEDASSPKLGSTDSAGPVARRDRVGPPRRRSNVPASRPPIRVLLLSSSAAPIVRRRWYYFRLGAAFLINPAVRAAIIKPVLHGPGWPGHGHACRQLFRVVAPRMYTSSGSISSPRPRWHCVRASLPGIFTLDGD